MPADDPFIAVRWVHDHAKCRGEPRFFRGHTLPGHGGEPADGIYAEWSWTGNELIVRNDRYGVSPLFYCEQKDGVSVSPSIATLLAQGAPADLDETAIAVFLRLGFYIGDDTPFLRIRAVPPGGMLRWKAGTLATSGGYSIPKPAGVSRQQALDGFVALFHQAIGRRLPIDDRAIVPLSGGRDSRHILFELCAHGRPPRCTVTIPRYPPRPHEDERIAPLVARAVGVPHVLLDQDGSRFHAEIAKNRETHFCADEHAWYMRMVEALGSATTVYDGLGGALSVPSRFSSAETLALFDSGRTTELAERLFNSFSLFTESFLSKVVKPGRRAGTSREQATARLSAELMRHASAPDPVKSFNFWNRIRRELALVPYGLMRHIKFVYSPYLDRDVYDFMMALAPTVMSETLASSDKSFHTDAVHRAFPEYAHIPFESKGVPAVDPSAHNTRLALAVSRYLLANRQVPSRLLNRSYVLPRLTLGLLRRGNRRSRGGVPSLALYLFQLEAAATGHAESAELRPWPSSGSPVRDAIAITPGHSDGRPSWHAVAAHHGHRTSERPSPLP